jgi:tRNA (guanine-N7-)-methyltransferase
MGRIVGALMESTDFAEAVADQAAASRHIRTFHPRRGRMGARHADALETLWPRFGYAVEDCDHTPVDPAALFGRSAPVVLEIGFGMGDTTALTAAANPDRDHLAVEVHTPGVANLLALIGEAGLANVRVARGDALHLARRLPADSLAAVHVFFPDPWPKARHHKRRLVQPDHVALLSSRLRPGGVLHCATDWTEYAEAMAATLDAAPTLTNTGDGFAPRPDSRPVTKFERRGVAAGRQIFDLIYQRT